MEETIEIEQAVREGTMLKPTTSGNYASYTRSMIQASSTLFSSAIDIGIQQNKGRVPAVFQGSNIEDFEDLRVIKSIGKGAFSEVFQAINLENKKEYALRLCKIDGKCYTQDRAFKEINIYSQLRNLDHPNIAKIYSAKLISSTDEEEDIQSLQVIMELGVCTLEDVFKNRQRHQKPWTEIELLHISMMLVHPLQIAKENGISHRDISLNNVILAKDLKNYKLIDFAEVTCDHLGQNRAVGA